MSSLWLWMHLHLVYISDKTNPYFLLKFGVYISRVLHILILHVGLHPGTQVEFLIFENFSNHTLCTALQTACAYMLDKCVKLLETHVCFNIFLKDSHIINWAMMTVIGISNHWSYNLNTFCLYSNSTKIKILNYYESQRRKLIMWPNLDHKRVL